MVLELLVVDRKCFGGRFCAAVIGLEQLDAVELGVLRLHQGGREADAAG